MCQSGGVVELQKSMQKATGQSVGFSDGPLVFGVEAWNIGKDPKRKRAMVEYVISVIHFFPF